MSMLPPSLAKRTACSNTGNRSGARFTWLGTACAGGKSSRSTRSNNAVFMPWIDDAEGHSRSAICSSSQRAPRSAVTAAGRPPSE